MRKAELAALKLRLIENEGYGLVWVGNKKYLF